MQTNRREFIRKTGAASLGLSFFPSIIKASVLGREGHIPPGDKITMITGQKLHWDPRSEKFTDNNIYATRLLKRPYRDPWIFPE